MPASVRIGKDAETGQSLTIGDIERRSGLYILGKPGMGKSALIVNMMGQDIEHGHGLFFLDPHGDAITDLTERFDVSLHELESLCEYILLLDPTNERHSFGINPLACRDITSLKEREDTYKRAYNIFSVLWEKDEPFGPWLQLILEHTLYVFIENPESTLAEVPLFLTNAAFRHHLLENVKYNREVADFWLYEFGAKRERDQEALVQAALTRVRTLLAHRYVRDIVGQKVTTINFAELMAMRAIILVNLPANLASDSKRFIGAILISELVHAVRNRPTDHRDQFCIFVDEFQNFASDEDFGTLITEARKFGVATTIAHQERFGQFGNNPKLLGATAAAANKVFFQLTVRDAQELAPEFAEKPEDTKTRMGGQLVPSPHVIEDIWERGHTDEHVMRIRARYFWLVDLLKQRPEEHEYIFDPRQMPTTPGNGGNLNYGCFNDWLGYRSSPEDIRHGLSLLNTYYYDCMRNGFKEQPITNAGSSPVNRGDRHQMLVNIQPTAQPSCGIYLRVNQSLTTFNHGLVQSYPNAELQLFLQIIDCFSGVYGYRQTMEPYISDMMREEFVRRMSAKQDREIMDIKRRIEEGFLHPPLMLHHARQDAWFYSRSEEGKQRELEALLQRENPQLLKKWFLEQVPQYFLKDWEVYQWTRLGREVFTSSELEEFIVWQRRLLSSQEKQVFAELVRVVSDIVVDEQRYNANKNRLYRQYTASIAQPLLFLEFGENHNELPFETIEPYMRVITERVVWQLTELQHFLIYCLRILPSFLARNPIKLQSAQYDEEPKRDITQRETIDIMAQDLANLPRFKAYAKVIGERDREQVVLSRKIETYPLNSLSKRRYAEEHAEAMRTIIENNTLRSGYCKAREYIEEEIRERQERWRKRRGNEPPPPTHTGGNTLPSLPSGSAGSDREPPPTHYIPEKAPEEKPPGNSDVSQQGTGAYRPQAREEKSLLAPLRPSPASASTSPMPSLQFESLRFFESGQQHYFYSTNFPQRTGLINFALTMRNGLYRQRSEIYSLKMCCFNPDGSLLLEEQQDRFIKFDNERPSHQWFRGWGSPGHWIHGTYRVVIYVDGVEFAEGSFTITDAEKHPSPSEKPPGNSDVAQSRTGTDDCVEARVRQIGEIIEFSSYQQNGRENEIVTPIESPETTPDEPIPVRLSPVPDLQTRQTLDMKESTGEIARQEKPKRKGKYATLREKLTPIVRMNMSQYEEKAKTDTKIVRKAAICALALGDKEAAERLSPLIMSYSNRDKKLLAGRLAILSDDEETARGIIKYIGDRYWSVPGSLMYIDGAWIAADLPDKTIVKRFMRCLERKGDRIEAARIALKINDKETIARVMQEAEQFGSGIPINVISLFAPYHPEIAKKIMKRLEKYEWKEVGVIAAVIRDNTVACRVMNNLKRQKSFHNACELAIIMGDIRTAEELMWESWKQDNAWFRRYYESAYPFIGQLNPKARFHLMQALESKGFDIGLIAAQILENLG